MPTPIDIFARLWLATWPMWGGPLPPASPTPVLTAAPVASTHAGDRNHDAASLLALSDEELKKKLEDDPAALGPLSIGSPGSARLVNAVSLAARPNWEIARTAQVWGTSETMAFIETVVDTVCELFSETPPLSIGDISGPDGGRLKRHESHQGGRDVDLGFYYTSGKGAWFTPGTARNLDLDRNWALVRALITRTDVEKIFLDTRIQKVLYRHALGLGEEKQWLDAIFGFARGTRDAIIQHVKGHKTHYHVRFYNAVAQELGRRAFPLLVEMNLVDPPVFTVRHLVRAGQTIAQIAERYHTSVKSIMQANRLRNTRLRAGRSYRVPVRGTVAASEPIVIPHRRLPNFTPPLLAAVDWPNPESLYGSSPER